MPIYKYLCLDCSKLFSCLVGVFADAEEPRCERCGGRKLRKLISRVARVRSKDSSLEDLADPTSSATWTIPKPWSAGPRRWGGAWPMKPAKNCLTISMR